MCRKWKERKRREKSQRRVVTRRKGVNYTDEPALLLLARSLETRIPMSYKSKERTERSRRGRRRKGLKLPVWAGFPSRRCYRVAQLFQCTSCLKMRPTTVEELPCGATEVKTTVLVWVAQLKLGSAAIVGSDEYSGWTWRKPIEIEQYVFGWQRWFLPNDFCAPLDWGDAFVGASCSKKCRAKHNFSNKWPLLLE